MRPFFRTVLKRTAYALFILLFTLLAAEITLRIYNPFPSSVVGDKIFLTPNYSKVYRNNVLQGSMDSMIVYKRNSIGLRGDEPPNAFASHLTIVAVGGSTTECMFISEGKTWEDLLEKKLRSKFPACWVNNAGFSGHSTFAHLILMRDYIVSLRPKICLFTVGLNDMGRTDLQPHDEQFTLTKQKWILSLARWSKLANAILTIYRNHLAKEKNVADNYRFNTSHYSTLELSESSIEKSVKSEQPLVQGYGSRIRELIRICRQNNIEPIFITQSSLMGDSKDSISGINLSSYKMNDSTNGKLYWSKLELYNNQTIAIAKDSGLLVIDVAHELPKSPLFFYDAIHFNNRGCEVVADLVAKDLILYLERKFPAFLK